MSTRSSRGRGTGGASTRGAPCVAVVATCRFIDAFDAFDPSLASAQRRATMTDVELKASRALEAARAFLARSPATSARAHARDAGVERESRRRVFRDDDDDDDGR